MATRDPVFSAYFGVLLRPQTYLNLLYLVLAFPLGLLYFILFSAGISTGLSLLVILVGIPILLAMVGMGWGLAAFERVLNRALLGARIPEDEEPATWQNLRESYGGFTFQTLMAYLRSGVWIRHSIYLGMKMPFGVFAFTLAVTVVGVGGGLLLAPLSMLAGGWGLFVGNPPFVDVAGSLIAMVMGLALLPLGLHLTNWVAALWRAFGESTLSPAPPPEVTIPAKDKHTLDDERYGDPFAEAEAHDKRKLADLINEDDPFYADDEDDIHLARPLHNRDDAHR